LEEQFDPVEVVHVRVRRDETEHGGNAPVQHVLDGVVGVFAPVEVAGDAGDLGPFLGALNEPLKFVQGEGAGQCLGAAGRRLLRGTDIDHRDAARTVLDDGAVAVVDVEKMDSRHRRYPPWVSDVSAGPASGALASGAAAAPFFGFSASSQASRTPKKLSA